MIRHIFTEVFLRFWIHSVSCLPMKLLLILAGFLLLYCTAASQDAVPDSVVQLPAVRVAATRLDNFSGGQKIKEFDSITLVQNKSLNLGELLAKNSALQINTYSHNGLSTLSFRGTSVSQTGIYWNGVQINPPNNGMVDLSLIPGAYFNSMRILYGGGSSLYGSGNIGGSIHLGSDADFNPHTRAKLGIRMGSFSEYGGEGSFSFSDGRWFLKTTVLGKQAENDFTYTDLSGKENKLQHAALSQAGIMQDVFFKPNKHWITGAAFWYQENNKELPATLTTKPSDASQFDRSMRSFVMASRYDKKNKLTLKSALFNDLSHFMDPDSLEPVSIDSKIQTLKAVTEFQYEQDLWTHGLLSTGLIYSYETGESDYYNSLEHRNQLGMFAMWSQYFPAIKWKMNLNLRQDLIDGYQVPFTPSFGMEGALFQFLSAKVNVSRNFRVPTFNDQFWVPGGNSNLDPEHSWNEEVSLIYENYMDLIRNNTRMIFTLYNSNVDNWILWVPEGQYWSAQNIQKVWSRGFEIEYKSTFSFHPVDIQFVGGYTYARSTNEQKQSSNDPTYQKQLIYVPEYRFFFTGSILVKGFIFSYNQAYTGERYVTRDNTEKIPAFSLGNVSFSKNISIGDQSLDLNFDVLNIWNIEYQAVQYNPMPGRNFKLSLLFNFNNNKTKNDEI